MTTLILSVFFTISASAYDVVVDGIYYILAKEFAIVTSGNKKYEGKVIIPESIAVNEENYTVTEIEASAFFNCSRLTSITIPNSVTSIGGRVFEYCSSLTSVTIPNSVTSIGVRAFGECSSLTSITIPNSVTSIGDASFADCSGLRSVSIPNSVTYIGAGAFYDCCGLSSITIPNSVTEIRDETFIGCSGLSSVTIPNSVTSIGASSFSGCSGLSSVTIPNSVTSVGAYSFLGCSGLRSVTIPNSVTYIGTGAFLGCYGLESITIGTGVKKIGERAFARCKKLETVTCLAEKVPETKSDAFDESWIEYATLTVPKSALQAYRTSAPWSGFGTFKTVEGTEVETKKCETPNISFVDGKLTFYSATKGVEYVSEVKCSDAAKYYTEEIYLAACYDISVTAMKTGYKNSDVATAKLYWLTSSGTLEGTGTSINNVAMRGIAIQSAGGFITISGLDNNEMIRFYAIDGKALGTATAINGTTSFTAQSSTVVVAQIGNRNIKIAVE